MKKIVKIIPIISILILTYLIVFYGDVDMRSRYSRIEGYQVTGIELGQQNDVINEAFLDKLATYANEHNVVLAKPTYDIEAKVKRTFYSIDSMEELLDKLQLDYEVVHGQGEKSFAATYHSGLDEQAFYIPDLVDNDKYELYSLSRLRDMGLYEYGSYSVFYQNETDLNNFFGSIAKDTGIPAESLHITSYGMLSAHTDLIAIAIIGGAFFSMLFYFITVAFQLYRQSRKIGCLQLLGFDNKGITKQVLKESMPLLITVSVIMLIIMKLLIRNITVTILLQLMLCYLLILLSTIAITYGCTLLISGKAKISNILKKESLVKKISNICLVSKVLFVAVLFLFVTWALPSLLEDYTSSSYVKADNIVMDYAVFTHYNVDNGDADDSNNFLEFY